MDKQDNQHDDYTMLTNLELYGTTMKKVNGIPKDIPQDSLIDFEDVVEINRQSINQANCLIEVYHNKCNKLTSELNAEMLKLPLANAERLMGSSEKYINTIKCMEEIKEQLKYYEYNMKFHILDVRKQEMESIKEVLPQLTTFQWVAFKLFNVSPPCIKHIRQAAQKQIQDRKAELVHLRKVDVAILMLYSQLNPIQLTPSRLVELNIPEELSGGVYLR